MSGGSRSAGEGITLGGGTATSLSSGHSWLDKSSGTEFPSALAILKEGVRKEGSVSTCLRGLGNLVPDLGVTILIFTVDAATAKADCRDAFCILFIDFDFDLHSVRLA